MSGNPEHLGSVEIPPLVLDVFADATHPMLAHAGFSLSRLHDLWSAFAAHPDFSGLCSQVGLTHGNASTQGWELSLYVVDDAAIRALNLDHRGKDAATDVLTFTLFADAAERPVWAALPEVSLGEIFISAEWAAAHAPPGRTLDYLLERVVHGWLHLLGQNHDTEADYARVLGIQRDVLRAIGLETTLPQDAIELTS